MLNKSLKYLVAFLAILCVGFTANANADTPPVPGAIPATPHTTTTVTGSSTTTSTESFNDTVKRVEQASHTKVVFYWKSEGLTSSKGCVNPVTKKYIKVGGKFKNTWLGNSIGWTKWKKGDLLCNVKHGRDSLGTYYTGTIKRCGNVHVKIYVDQKKIRKFKLIQVTEFKSHTEFLKSYHQNTTTHDTSTTSTYYTCDTAGYTLNGTWCYPVDNSSASCDYLAVRTSPSVNLGIDAAVFYTTSGGAVLKNVHLDWGDGTSNDIGKSASTSHTYSKGGDYLVNAVLTFSSPSGDKTQNCLAEQITPKDGTTGAGSTTGGTSGGTGSGGSAGTGTGTTCRDPATGDIRPGNHDQFGYCV